MSAWSRGGSWRGSEGSLARGVVAIVVVGTFTIIIRFAIAIAIIFGFICIVVIGKLDLIIEIAGVGRAEDGEGAAAGFGGIVGGFHRGDELADGLEAGVGECFGVWRHGNPRGKACDEAAEKSGLHRGAEMQICARKPAQFHVEKSASACQDWVKKSDKIGG